MKLKSIITSIALWGLLQPALLAEETGSSWNFDVFLGDKEIGYHRFTASELEEGRLVKSDADFEVRFLFIKAFEYEHSNSEVWQDGCLQSIDAETNANGKRFEVLGQQKAGEFVVQSGDTATLDDDCVGTFAYWDRDLLARDKLLNAQTGEYLDVDFKSLPRASLELGGREIPVERLHLSAKGIDIVVSYGARTGQWLGLDSTLKNGRTLVYRRSSSDLPADQALAMETEPAGSTGP